MGRRRLRQAEIDLEHGGEEGKVQKGTLLSSLWNLIFILTRKSFDEKQKCETAKISLRLINMRRIKGG